MKSWKTTAAGVLTIMMVVAQMGLDYTQGHPISVIKLIPMFVSGLGLIAAKDSNVTGGTKVVNDK